MPEISSHYEGRYLSLREIEDWQFASRPNSRGVVAIFAVTEANEAILIEQFRRPVQSRVLEIAAGLIGDEEGFEDEPVVDCARRELLEETGYTSDSMELLLESPTSAGMTDETTYLFLARNCRKTGAGGGVDGEDIATHLVPMEELEQFFEQSRTNGIPVDFKIHACLGEMMLRKIQTG